MQKIENAIFIHSNKMDDYYKKINEGFKIICIGSEFCYNRKQDFNKINEIFNAGAEKVVIYTSFLNQEMIKETKKQLSLVFNKYKNIEIMINDVGLLSYLNRHFPYIKKGIARPLSIDFMRMEYRYLLEITKRYKIDFIETDELDRIAALGENHSLSIFYRTDLKFVATTRFCPYTRKIPGICNNECDGKIESYIVPETANKYILSYENAFFVKIKNKKTTSLKIKRIINDFFNLQTNETLKSA